MKVLSLKNCPPIYKCLFVLVSFILALVFFPTDKEESKKTIVPTDAQAVSKPIYSEEDIDEDENDFFADYRSERLCLRSEKEELYQNYLEDVNLTSDDKNTALNSLELLYYKNSVEDKVEIILKGRNYEDVVFSFDDPLSLLIIKGRQLNDVETQSLSSFIEVYCGITPERLSIFSV